MEKVTEKYLRRLTLTIIYQFVFVTNRLTRQRDQQTVGVAFTILCHAERSDITSNNLCWECVTFVWFSRRRNMCEGQRIYELCDWTFGLKVNDLLFVLPSDSFIFFLRFSSANSSRSVISEQLSRRSL